MILERINEIRSILEEQILSNIQQFWVTLLHCRSIPASEECLVGTSLDFSKVFGLLGIPESEFQRIHIGFDYDNLSNPDNIVEIEYLFDLLHTTLSDFNQTSYSVVSFKNFHTQELGKLRDKI